MSGSEDRSMLRVLIAMLVCVALLVGAQAMAYTNAPSGGVASTGRILGQTGFAYLGGLRTFAAAVLWNRLEPLYHGYYGEGTHVDQLAAFLPTMRLVQTLDPQFQQAYYNSSWILYRRGKLEEGLQVAREGIKNNPKSGLLMANLLQLLLIQDKVANLPEMLALSRQGIGQDTQWASADDQFEGYGVFRTIFELAGDSATASQVDRAQKQLRSQGAGLGIERDGTSGIGGR